MTDRLMRHVRPEQFRELILLLVTIGAMLFFWTQIPNYFDPRSVNRLTVGFAIPLVVAVGQMMVVLTRNIDLSVSSTVGLSAYVVGTFLTKNDVSPWIAALLAILLGCGLGAINGLLVAYGGVPAIITTLGTMAIYRVVLVEISGAKTVTTGDLPTWIGEMPSKTVATFEDYDLIATGGLQGAAGETFDAGRMGTYTIEADPTRPDVDALRIVMGPFSVYNKENPGV